MKKTIYTKFDKALITALPVVEFPGRIITILTAGEAERAVDYLLTQPILGIDTETRPAFRKGKTYKVSGFRSALRKKLKELLGEDHVFSIDAMGQKLSVKVK